MTKVYCIKKFIGEKNYQKFDVNNIYNIKYFADNVVVNLYMIVANLYDDKLNDIPKAIYYYDLFLDKMTSSKSNFKSDYAESIKKRLDFLKEKKNPAVNKN